MNGMSLDCCFWVSATNTAHPKIDIKHQKYELINPFEFWAPKLSHRGGHATALGEVKPFKDALNKSESCRYNASGLGEGAPHDRWTSEFCNFRGATFSEVVVI